MTEMVKAVFIDYTGTTVQEEGNEIKEVVIRICKNSSIHDPKEAVQYWWKLVKQYEESSYGENYLTEDEIVEKVLGDMSRTVHLRENLEELHELLRGFWVHAPLFEDAETFYKNCEVPLYVITNNGVSYVERSMKEKGLSPAGIISADMVKAYKPHRELFEKALRVSGCRSDEAVHIGDSYDSDVLGAQAAGIRPILIDRTGNQAYRGITVVHSLREILNKL